MTEPSAQSSNEAKHIRDGNLTDDDASDITPTDIRNTKRNEQVFVEKTFKFMFSPKERSDDPVHPSIVHIQWIREVQDALGNDIEVFDNKGKKLPKIDPLRWTKDQHSNSFNLQRQRDPKSNQQVRARISTGRENKAFLVHRVRTSWSLSEIKRLPSVMKLLRDYGVFLTEHKWSETIWNTTQIGFIVGMDPHFYDPEQATAKVTQDLLKNASGHPKIPAFRMVHCTPSTTTNTKNHLRTKAYAIEIEKSSSADMVKLIKQAYKDTGTFVSFQMRSKHPDIFLKAIRMQTSMLAANHTIVLNNIGTDAMLYLAHWIEQVEGVHEILPFKSVDIDGRYRILVNKKDFHRIRSHISNHLPQWYTDHVVVDAHPHPNRFPGEPGVASIKSDEYSSSEGSYMARTVNTILSYAETVSTQHSKTTNDDFQQRNYFNDTSRKETWADRAAGRQPLPNHVSIPPTGHQVTQENESILTELASRKAEVEALKLEVHSLRAEREQYQAKIDQQVQDKVAQAVQLHLAQFNQPSQIVQTQFEMMMTIQKESFKEFSSQILQMMHMQRVEMLKANHQESTVLVTAGKRSVETAGNTSSLTDSQCVDTSEERKRIDNKPTPKKLMFPSKDKPTEFTEEDSESMDIEEANETILDQHIRLLQSPPESPYQNRRNTDETLTDTPNRGLLKGKSSITIKDDEMEEEALHAELHTAPTGFIAGSKSGNTIDIGLSTPIMKDV